jgi:fructoselysine-6-P-deglycase FrlB-like protein
MAEPQDYLTEETYRPYWLKDGVTEQTIDVLLKQKPVMVKLGKELSKYKKFYLIGSGGSYSVQLPIKYLSERYTDTLIHAYSGMMFLEQHPEALDKDAACIFISQSGKTKEILEALDWCNDQGAKTIGLTQKTKSDINDSATRGVAWEGQGVTLGKLGSLYLIFGTMFEEKGFRIGSRMVDAVSKLPDVLPGMIPIAKSTGKKQGLDLKDYDDMFVLGGGINWGLTYQFSFCTLMEMCWVKGIPINYSEFRHGPLEVFTEGTAALFLRGRGEQRTLEQKIIDFVKGNRVKCIEYDSQGLDVDNLLTPFTLFEELEWLSYYLSLARNRRMGTWRYYDKVDF